MKNLLTIFALLFFNALIAQNSDTMTCVQGIDTLQYFIDYDDQSCIDSCDSYYSISHLIGSGNYMYQITGNSGFNSTNSVEPDMCPDDYVCIVTDMTTGIACTILFSIDTVVPPPPVPALIHSIDLTHCSATGVCDGEAELTISGGNPPYIITWYDAGQTPIPFEDSIVLDSLCAGNYFYSVSNTSNGVDGCGVGFPGEGTGLTPFTINEDLQVTVVWTTDEMCEFMCDGGAEVMAVGGTGNYTYDIGVQSSSAGIFYNLCPTVYSVTVTDDQGNTGSDVFEIYPAFPSFGFANVTDETCNQACDGTITFDNSSGDLVQYSIDGGFTYFNDMIFTDLCPDNYSLTAYNVYGCLVYIGDYTINPGDGPVISSIESTMASGSGISDGCITQVDVSGGLPGYTFTIDGNINTIPACGLPSGIYNVCVSDQNGCSTCESVQINECTLDAQTSFNEPTCFGGCDGVASVFISGANGPVVIDWQDDNGLSIGNMETINNLCPGIYNYFITDSLGCETSGMVDLTGPNSIVINTTIINGITTDAACLGEIEATATGGHDSFTYEWFKCGINASVGTGATISNLCPGEYYAVATDFQGCEAVNTCDTIQKIIGIQENELQSFDVHPNPSNDIFTIETQITGEYNISIIDLSGKVVFETVATKSTMHLSSENEQLSQGIYFIEIDQENVQFRKRIVIQ